MAAVRKVPPTEMRIPSQPEGRNCRPFRPPRNRRYPPPLPERRAGRRPVTVVESAHVHRLVTRWTTLPTVQSMQIQEMLAASRRPASKPVVATASTALGTKANIGATLNWSNLVFKTSQGSEFSTGTTEKVTPVAMMTNLVDDSKCSGGPTANQPAPPHSGAPPPPANVPPALPGNAPPPPPPAPHGLSGPGGRTDAGVGNCA